MKPYGRYQLQLHYLATPLDISAEEAVHAFEPGYRAFNEENPGKKAYDFVV